MMFAHRIFALLLVLCMVATTGSMAMMRDRDAGTQSMVICNGSGLQTILLDANGNETDPAPICPDCTMVLMVQGATPPMLMLRGTLVVLPLELARDSQSFARLYSGGVHARAPPRLA